MDDYTEDDRIAFCLVDERTVYIRAVLPVEWSHDPALFTKLGLAPHLSHSKHCGRLRVIDESGLRRIRGSPAESNPDSTPAAQ